MTANERQRVFPYEEEEDTSLNFENLPRNEEEAPRKGSMLYRIYKGTFWPFTPKKQQESSVRPDPAILEAEFEARSQRQKYDKHQSASSSRSLGNIPFFKNKTGSSFSSSNKFAGVKDPDQLGTKLYTVIKKNKLVPFKNSKLMIVGQARVGKTSLLKALLQIEHNPEEPSTVGCKLDSVNIYSDGSQSQWKVNMGERLLFIRMLNDALLAGKTLGRPNKVPRYNPRERNSIKGEDIQDRYIEAQKLHADVIDSDISLTVYDFGGQKVFYSLHHMFLTEYGCYLIVFNAHALYQEIQQGEQKVLDYLSFWLNSKKLHAKNSPTLLVGTFCETLRSAEILEVSKFLYVGLSLRSRVTPRTHLVVRNTEKAQALNFFPVDNAKRIGVENLTKHIQTEIMKAEYFNEAVALGYVHLYDYLVSSKVQYIQVVDLREETHRRGIYVSNMNAALRFLMNRGLIFYQEIRGPQNLVIIDPQWLIEAITKLVFDSAEHPEPNFDDTLRAEYNFFIEKRILSGTLMKNIWHRAGFAQEIQTFLTKIMESSLLMSSYKFERSRDWFIPLFQEPYESFNPPSRYSGLFFVLDFSGAYEKPETDCVQFLPYGLFEKILCTLVKLSSSYFQSERPKIEPTAAYISFGLELHFCIYMCSLDNRKGIRVQMQEGTSQRLANDLIRQIWSVVTEIKEKFFSQHAPNQTTKPSLLSCKLLLPSNEVQGAKLAGYETLRMIRRQPKVPYITPVIGGNEQVPVHAYDHWFNEEAIEGETDSFWSPSNRRSLISWPGGNGQYRELAPHCDYHCFLSYKQTDSTDIIEVIYTKLESLGFRCWFDMKYRGRNGPIPEAMVDGVNRSMVYVLFLSKNIFDSPSVLMEIKAAKKDNKEILLLHHPETGIGEYPNFEKYIEAAPPVISDIFYKSGSIQYLRQFYQQHSFFSELERRLESIRTDLIDY
eukprot:augustus_masked-scaffold_13-processed-gene-10.15-mRNA-1 protein AED:1.00 eAED:1.00 QI:0/-1/0/0/-1/1/1/0/941